MIVNVGSVVFRCFEIASWIFVLFWMVTWVMRCQVDKRDGDFDWCWWQWCRSYGVSVVWCGGWCRSRSRSIESVIE